MIVHCTYMVSMQICLCLLIYRKWVQCPVEIMHRTQTSNRSAQSIINANIRIKNKQTKTKNQILCPTFFNTFLSLWSLSLFFVLYFFLPFPLSPSLNTSSQLLSSSASCFTRQSLFYSSFYHLSQSSPSSSSSLCTVGLLIGPFGPPLPSRLCLCQSPAAFHWMLAADGAKQEEIKLLNVEGKHWDRLCLKDEQHNVIFSVHD